MYDDEKKLDGLKDNMRLKVIGFLNEARNSGLDVFIFEGIRTVKRQYMLFGYGRNQATLRRYGVPVRFSRPNEKVRTWTLESKHMQGSAVDIVFNSRRDPKRLVPSWNGDYKKLIEIGKRHGLRNLAPIELCHFEDDGSDYVPKNIESQEREKKKLANVLKIVAGKMKILSNYESSRKLMDQVIEFTKKILG